MRSGFQTVNTINLDTKIIIKDHMGSCTSKPRVSRVPTSHLYKLIASRQWDAVSSWIEEEPGRSDVVNGIYREDNIIGRTDPVLHFAIEFGAPLEVIKKIYYINTDVLDPKPEEPYFSAFRWAYDDCKTNSTTLLETIKFLHEVKPNVLLQQDYYGETPLFYFACDNKDMALDDLRLITFLCEKAPSTIDVENRRGDLPIDQLAYYKASAWRYYDDPEKEKRVHAAMILLRGKSYFENPKNVGKPPPTALFSPEQHGLLLSHLKKAKSRIHPDRHRQSEPQDTYHLILHICNKHGLALDETEKLKMVEKGKFEREQAEKNVAAWASSNMQQYGNTYGPAR